MTTVQYDYSTILYCNYCFIKYSYIIKLLPNDVQDFLLLVIFDWPVQKANSSFLQLLLINPLLFSATPHIYRAMFQLLGLRASNHMTKCHMHQ